MVSGGPVELMSDNLQSDLIATAQQKCWVHVEVATTMTRVLDALRGLQATSVIPILSSEMPTIMITPDKAGDLLAIRATVRWIAKQLDQVFITHTSEWERIPVNEAWLLRLHCDNKIIIDVMTRLPAVKEATIEV